MGEFINTDFAKSGISQETIDEYIKQGFLQEDEMSWTIYYPELFDNKKTEYYNKRLKNPQGNKYIKPKGKSSKVFRDIKLDLNSCKYLIITEGEKKAIKLAQEGFNGISLSGVWCWKQNPENSTDDDILSADIIPDIANLNLKNKEIYLCYDNDMWQKEQVKKALYHFALYLKFEKKATVKIVTLPKEDDKLGLDDYLVKYGNNSFKRLLDEAKEISVDEIQNELSGQSKSNKIKFPVEIFPENVGNNLVKLASSLDAPIEYISSAFLGCISIIMNGRYSICASPNQKWSEEPTLWLAIVGNPGQKKTHSLARFKKIIDKYEQELENAYNEEKKQYEIALNQYYIDLKRYKKDSSKMQMPQKPEEPKKQRLTTQDITVEALSRQSHYNELRSKRSVSIDVDELTFFLNSLNQYKKDGSDKQYFLQKWFKQRVNTVRQDKDFTTNLPHCIIGTTQPAVLNDTILKKGTNSYDGFIERWLFCLSDFEETGIYSDDVVDDTVFEKVFDNLYYGDEEAIYYFSKDAQKGFSQFLQHIVQVKKSKRLSDLEKSYIQKQTNYVARFALILHCITNKNIPEISTETLNNAIKLSDYFVKCFDIVIKNKLIYSNLEEDILTYIKQKGTLVVSPSEIFKSNMSKFKSKSFVEECLIHLSSIGRGRIVKTKNGGKKFIFYE